jgi:hypothetical protein
MRLLFSLIAKPERYEITIIFFPLELRLALRSSPRTNLAFLRRLALFSPVWLLLEASSLR